MLTSEGNDGLRWKSVMLTSDEVCTTERRAEGGGGGRVQLHDLAKAGTWGLRGWWPGGRLTSMIRSPTTVWRFCMMY